MTEIRQLITRIIQKYGTRDPFELAKSVGMVLKYKCLPTNLLGYYTYFACRKIIVLNDKLENYIHRLTVAHELGHYFLHPGYNRSFLLTHTLYNKGKIEKEADIFAAELLLPAGNELECELCQMTLEQVAASWQVTPYILELKINMNDT